MSNLKIGDRIITCNVYYVLNAIGTIIDIRNTSGYFEYDVKFDSKFAESLRPFTVNTVIESNLKLYSDNKELLEDIIE